MTQLTNQFSQTAEKGMIDLANGTATAGFACQVVSGESTALVPAQAVKLSDTASKSIVVTAVDDTTDSVFGFVAYDVKKSSWDELEMVKVFGAGSVILMEAGAAIARGASLEYVVTGQKVQTQATGTVIGTCLDKATASGDLVRVLLTVNG